MLRVIGQLFTITLKKILAAALLGLAVTLLALAGRVIWRALRRVRGIGADKP
jgi:hypothetical protein